MKRQLGYASGTGALQSAAACNNLLRLGNFKPREALGRSGNGIGHRYPLPGVVDVLRHDRSIASLRPSYQIVAKLNHVSDAWAAFGTPTYKINNQLALSTPRDRRKAASPIRCAIDVCGIQVQCKLEQIGNAVMIGISIRTGD